MQTVSATKFDGVRSMPADGETIAVAISAASPDLRAKLEAMACLADARVVAENAKFDLLLIGVDHANQFPSSISGLNLLHSASAQVCIIWMDDAGQAPTAQLLRLGVAGVLSENVASRRLRAALSAMRVGLKIVDPTLQRSEFDSNRDSLREELTHREQQVLAMMGQGLSNKEISARLEVSTHTVKFHISSILGKLGAASRTEAVSIGVKTGRLTI